MITIECRVCHEARPVNCTDDEYRAWQGGKLIQLAMPSTPKEERELLISGTCGACFTRIFTCRRCGGTIGDCECTSPLKC
jgi:hypothetical protein